MILFSDRGTPYSYRHMHGFGSHTFSMINAQNKRVWVKFHVKTNQGIRNFTGSEADEMKGKDPDWAQGDLVGAIESGDFPTWSFKIQVMTQEQAKTFRWNPFDLTKVWPQGDFPLIDVGQLELNKIPENYFRDVEQAAFAPAHVPDGIGYSFDKMLQGRLLSYPDAHRHRLGPNYEQIPVNRPLNQVHNYQRDGAMRVDENGGDAPNYSPNSFDNIETVHSHREPAMELESNVADWFDRNENDDDHWTQPGMLFRNVMTDQERENTINNFIGHMKGINGPKREEIIGRQLGHFHKADKELAMRVAEGLNVTFVVNT
jgi:catalase